jgi:glycosyltransferase involved in cell wall biosynthesis
MVIFYFGADKPWVELKPEDFKRRNVIYLKTLGENEGVEKVITVTFVDRKKFIRHFFSSFRAQDKISDLYLSDLFVIGSWRADFLSRAFNFVYASWMVSKYRKRDVVGWVYWPNGLVDYGKTGLRLKYVFDADHNLLEDPNIDVPHREYLEKLLGKAAHEAHLVVSASRTMLRWFERKGVRKTYRLMNGIDLSRFTSSAQNQSDKFTVVYSGVLSAWIDYDLFERIVAMNADVKFVIIGKNYVNDSYKRIASFKNVELLGEKSAKDLAALLPTFNVGLALYDSTKMLDGDSMKIYEYLAAGLPVISTNFHPHLTDDFRRLIHIANNEEEVTILLRQARSRGLKPAANEVKTFLTDVTWSRRLQNLFDSDSL